MINKSGLQQSRALVPVGPRHVQTRRHSKRDENGLKPSTSRALVLRNGKYGARGTGELMLAGRITGREKLDLLAEDLVAHKSALMAPFDLGKCMRIADSQFNAYLDDIADLKDPEMFYSKIMSELFARMSRGSQNGPQSLRNASHVASTVSTKIHNAYMVASGWRLVTNILLDLQRSGLKDTTARTQLLADDSLRSRYLALCDIVGVLVDLGQANFSILAMTSPHYSRYFKEVENVDPGESSIAFDWDSLKDACKSFLDSIIIELCFPRAPYPRRILYQILHDAVDESPGDAKRFPQSLWDAVGDLSVSLGLQELLESPLLGPEGEALKTLPRQMPEQYERWLDAQICSKQASGAYANLKDLFSPLEGARNPSVLDNMWKLIDLNYKAASGLSLDSLWQLDNALHRAPQWSSIYMPELRTYDSDSDNERHSLSLQKAGQMRTGGKKRRKKLLALTNGGMDDDDAEDMPGLQSYSDTSDESDKEESVPGTDEEEESDDGDEETNYDSEEEESYRTMLKKAMNTAMEIPEFFDHKSVVPEVDALEGEKRGNPFLKMLGSLRGRMFSSDARLSSTTRTEPRQGIFEQKRRAAKALTEPVSKASNYQVSDSKISPAQPTTSKERPPDSTAKELKDHRVAIEDAEDEEDVSPVGKKKKKKKPKKKKKKKEEANELPTVHEDCVPAIPDPPQSTISESPDKPSSNKVTDASPSLHARTSISSIPVEYSNAQSAHSYLQEIGAPREKVKSRPNHASIFAEKGNLFSKFKSKDTTNAEDDGSDPTINKKFTWFTKLGHKTAGYMHQLLRTDPEEKTGTLKWDDFVKVMRDMGFKYDPSTAGSSVRFDPPNPKDRSISIHKPHPKTTIHAHKLREIGDKLKKYYGWSKEDFLRRTSDYC